MCITHGYTRGEVTKLLLLPAGCIFIFQLYGVDLTLPNYSKRYLDFAIDYCFVTRDYDLRGNLHASVLFRSEEPPCNRFCR